MVIAGSGPTVVLLHGFPETWWTWHRLIPALVDAGFRVVAPDQRGYGESDKPPGVAPYRVRALVGDIVGLLDALGVDRACVLGHDWGAQVAWQLAMDHPDRVVRLAILNLPHPARFAESLRTVRQLRKSWYIAAFQLPGVAEHMLRHWGLRKAWRGRSPDAFSAEDLAIYEAAFLQPGALTPVLAWYRAAARDFVTGNAPKLHRIDLPVLVIFGERDEALHRDFAEPDPKRVTDVKMVWVPEASHWVQHDAPEIVRDEVIAFFRA